MKAIMVMFDSLNRDMLSSYGCNWTYTPNFKRLLDKTVVFDNCYVGSLPCMPARRELHTGRFNFLHRSWGPIEPFDDSMPEILKNNGITSHLVSDHQHYWEDGGATYHTRYSSWEISRGQEGDPWKCDVDYKHNKQSAFKGMNVPLFKRMQRQDAINREYMNCEERMSQAVTFKNGIEFIDKNKDADNWFLQIETFDPHEPFFSMEQYKKLYKNEYKGNNSDWPPYYFVEEDNEVINNTRLEYAALLSMCDAYLGKVLDKMDEHNMWEDTMLIVNTDHGYLLGEHGWWSKSVMPVYNEIANTPLFIWDPRSKVCGERRNALVQSVDLAPTILEFFNLAIPKDMEGKPLKDTIINDKSIRDYAIFGYHGAHINCTDGKYMYMKAPSKRGNSSLYEYTLMPTHMRNMFSPQELQNIELAEPFEFTKGCKTMKIKAGFGVSISDSYNYGTKLYNIQNDPKQETEIDDIDVEVRMLNKIREFMISNEAPIEQYERYGLSKDKEISSEELIEHKKFIEENDRLNILPEYLWTRSGNNATHALLSITPKEYKEVIIDNLVKFLESKTEKTVEGQDLINFVNVALNDEQKEMALYFVKLASRTN